MDLFCPTIIITIIYLHAHQCSFNHYSLIVRISPSPSPWNLAVLFKCTCIPVFLLTISLYCQNLPLSLTLELGCIIYMYCTCTLVFLSSISLYCQDLPSQSTWNLAVLFTCTCIWMLRNRSMHGLIPSELFIYLTLSPPPTNFNFTR